MIFRLLFLFIIVMLWDCAQSQTYSHKHYTPHNGLPHFQVMNLFQDSYGYLWIGTKGGVCRFDGSGFETFNTRNGLADNEVIGCVEDQNKVIWIITRQGITSFDGIKLNKSVFDDIALEKKIAFDGDSKLWALDANRRVIQFNLETNNITRSYPANGFKGANLLFDSFNDRLLISTKQNQILALKNNILDEIAGPFEQGYNLLHSSKNKIFLKDAFHIYSLQDGVVKKEQKLLEKFRTMNFVNEDLNYIATTKELYRSYKGNVELLFNSFNLINQIYIDREDNVWVASEQGLYLFGSTAFINFYPEDGPVDYVWSFAEGPKGDIWMASFSDGLCRYDGQEFIQINSRAYSNNIKQTHFYYGAIRNKNDLLFPTNNGVIKYDGQVFSKLDGSGNLPVLYIHEDKKQDELYLGTKQKVIHLSADGKKLISPPYTQRYIITILKDEQGILWMGSYDGLFSYNPLTGTHTDQSHLIDGANGVISLHLNKEGNIYIGSTNGLWLFDIKESTSKKILENEIQNSVNFIIPIDPQKLAIGLHDGLGIIEKQGNNFKVMTYNYGNGFSGYNTDQNAALLDSKGNLWVAASNMICKVNPNELKESKSQSVQIEHVLITGDNEQRKFSADERIIIPSENIEIEISHPCISYFVNSNEPYFARIIKDKKLYDTLSYTGHRLQLSNLPAGQYEFEFSKGSNNIPSSVQLSVRENFANSKFTKLLYAMIPLGFIYLLINLYRKNRNEKILQKKNEELELAQKENELKTLKQRIKNVGLEAIQAQMHFHFTSNALQAIQYFIYNDEKEVAATYLNNLTLLLRSFLTAFDDQTYTLRNEIDFINLYVDFEKLRFEQKFNLTIKIDDDIDLEEFIPPMLFQPFVENAITHAFIDMDEPGQISLNLYMDIDDVVCEISDNGVGRSRNKMIQERRIGSAASKGILLFEERLKLMDQSGQNKISFVITDRTENHDRPGTKVTIRILPSYEE